MLRRMPLRPVAVPPAEPAAELRVQRRLRVSADIRAHVPERDLRLSTVTRDLSERGLFVMTDAPLEIGDLVELAIDLPSQEFELDTFEVVGRVVRGSERGFGIALDAPPEAFAARIGELGSPDDR